MKGLSLNLLIALQEIETLKGSDGSLCFRIETCVTKNSVKLYVIKNEHIKEVITIDGIISKREAK